MSPRLFVLPFVLLLGCPDDTDDDSAIADDDTSGDDDSTADDDDSVADDDTSGDDDSADPKDPPVVVPATYRFESAFTPGVDSVAYSGQTLRHVLIDAMKTHIGGLTARIDGGLVPAEGDIVAELDFYYLFDASTSGTVAHGLAMMPAPLQATFGEIGAANLATKIAGAEPIHDHRDWTTAFRGWAGAETGTPDALVRQWFGAIEDGAILRATGATPLDPGGAPVANPWLSPEGLDHRELIQKFLLGAVVASQGLDKYLDDNTASAGLNSDNLVAVTDKPYTALEHSWDEGFGYWGAARDFAAWADADTVAQPYRDTFNPDGAIDIHSEAAFGPAVTGARRDVGSDAAAPTDFTGTIFAAFLEGRAIITASAGAEMSEDRRARLLELRDIIRAEWEATNAAWLVSYINMVIQRTATMDDPGYDFALHAQRWSEMKGIALSFQFSPASLLSETDFADLHTLLGAAPVLPGGDGAAYILDLLDARALIGDRCGFDPANLGADDGTGGW